ncbi:HtaA domain-containing protein [Streptomyces sp. NPDC051183]|uniref:HtaA domain-containing protein n=1 Tax=Streptomyces sp. NPDC051183 TaxID=3155165 RepID=UPI00342644B2
MSSNRRPINLAAAVLTAAALGVTAFAIPATAAGEAAPGAAPAAAPVMKVIGGTFDWGVLERYRKYVTRPVEQGGAGGTITGSDGARVNADGTFQLGAVGGAYDPAAHTVKAAFKGGVTFASPAHGFEVTLSDFRFDTATQKVTADVAKKGAETKQDVPLADFVAGRSTENLPTKITEQAAAELGGPYKGVDGDPLTVKLEFEKPASPSATPSSTPSSRPTPTPTPTPTPSRTATTTAQPTATATADGPQKVLGGKLTWGVKESFRRYVQSAGSITPAGGAVKSGDLFDFAFGKGELDAKKQKLSASFEGNLRFQYAAHGIDMSFANLRVEATGKAGTLYVDVTNASGTKAGVPFATLDLSKTDYRTKGGVLALNAVPAAFTAEGAATFANATTGSMYHAGDPVDPVSFSVAVDKDATLSATGGTTGGTAAGGSTAGGAGSVGGNLATTGSEIPAGTLLGASAAVIAAGAGAVFLGRRRRTVLS